MKKNLVILFIGMMWLFSCEKSNSGIKDEEVDADKDESTLSEPPSDINGAWLTCLQTSEEKYGCAFMSANGQKYSGEVKNWHVTLTEPSGNEHKIIDFDEEPLESRFHITFGIPEEIRNTNFYISTALTVENYVIRDIDSCPKGYIEVPGEAFYETSNFCVMKFEAKKGEDGLPTSSPTGAIFNDDDLSVARAKELCSSIGGKFSLLKNYEWLTMAVNIVQQGVNWSSGTIGKGELNVGHSDNDPNRSLEVTDVTSPCSDTNNINCTNKLKLQDFHQKRTHLLSNGEEIWDLAGNVWEWVDLDDLTIRTNSKPDALLQDFDKVIEDNDTTQLKPIVPYNEAFSWWDNSWTSKQGLGQYYASGKEDNAILRRGGSYDDKVRPKAGIFSVSVSIADTIPGTGFRCVFHK